MNRWLALLCFTFIMSAVACTPPSEKTAPPSPAPSPQPEPVPPKPPADLEELPFDYGVLQEDVRIQLDSAPRLHSPVNTVVTPEPQAFTLYFREAMNRPSVEEALRKRAEEVQEEWQGSILPAFSFRWASDRQLRLLVTVPPGEEPDHGGRRYLLDVKGAKTQQGMELEDPPVFTATLYAPKQLWRVSVDGQQKEQLSSFTEPYFTLKFLDDEHRYLLLSRFLQYCECDADHERMYAVYDVNTRKLTPYPLPLQTTYMGEGDFVADRRGFFYAKPGAESGLSSDGTAVPIRVDSYIHGAGFSKDHSHVFMAVGKKGQTGDFDLLIRNLDSGQEQRFPQALKGMAPQNELSGGPAPVFFQDDGENVTFAMRDPLEYKERRYAYTWKTGKVTVWQPPIPPESWSGYTQSSDGLYQLYANGGLYKGKTLISEHFPYGYWLTGTHVLVYQEYLPAGGSSKLQIKRFDADRNETKTIMTDLPPGIELIGTSPDGEWIYIQSHVDLTK
ncbi:hypothetical protein [Brevibacillus sp. H7]|uniref:hypothetical protein n=1 Tax=Brevibacillus sp. H7 TaxID=3349138 RepID=UPI003808B9D3